MGDTIRVELVGERELLAKLDSLGISAKRLLEEAVSAGAAIVRDAAREQAPGPEIEMELERSSETSATAEVGPDKDHWYYRFHEFGAGTHAIAGNPLLVFDGDSGVVRTHEVSHPGMAARPFMRPAMDGKQDEASDAMGKTFNAGIEAIT